MQNNGLNALGAQTDTKTMKNVTNTDHRKEMELLLLTTGCKGQSGEFVPIEQALAWPFFEYALSNYIDIVQAERGVICV